LRVLVVYDISDDATRSRVAKWLLSRGFTRIQRSAYVARGGVALARDVARHLEKMIDRSRDVVHIVVLQDYEWEMRIEVGSGALAVEL